VWLALLLLVPGLGDAMAPLGYGRWVTVHLNASLYGWSSVPLLGLLFRAYLPRRGAGWMADVALMAWSGMLLFAVTGWLSGRTSGKLFMEWTGASRTVMAMGMGGLALALAVALGQRWREGGVWWGHGLLKAGALVVMAGIPVVMVMAADPSLYPPVNPDSGGATGGSLLGSTLALVALYVVVPWLLGLERRGSLRGMWFTAGVLVAHLGWFALLDHGDQSHYAVSQRVALSSLVIWVPLLVVHFRRFVWPQETRRWLAAFGVWGVVLTINGIGSFLPGVLDHWKFTNAMVGHVHIAMAGMVSNFNFLVLVALQRSTRWRGVLETPRAFWVWQGGTVIHAGALLIAGTLEAMHPSWLFEGHPVMTLLYTVRLLAGVAMAGASIFWFIRFHTFRGASDDAT
jgi:cytochrome c oxidase cbb3-type subunit 1